MPPSPGDVVALMTDVEGSAKSDGIIARLARLSVSAKLATGDTAFTVPLFDEFMRRIMPGNEWRAEGGV